LRIWWTQAFLDSQFVELAQRFDWREDERVAVEVRASVSLLGLPQGAWVMDLGCFYGRWLVGLHNAGMNPVGLDFSEACLAEATQYLNENKVPILLPWRC
jgi:2-polyprenyl-3-methyl-5-hydroxy-6-metoxy-1,4-benzoquinol methylase